MNPKQQRFVDEYLTDRNATQAAIRAGYSKKSARSQAHDLLTIPYIAAAVAQRTVVVAEKAEISAVTVLRELQRIALVDIREAFATEADVAAKRAVKVGELLHPMHMPLEFRRAVSGFDVTAATDDKGAVTRLRLSSKDAALEKLCKHLGLYKVDNDQKGASFSDLVLSAQRLREGKA